VSHDDRSKLSFRARAILDDLRRAAHAGRHQLSGRGGVVVLHETLATLEEADRASLHRRVAVLPPREQPPAGGRAGHAV
jgi:hypothetical protein